MEIRVHPFESQKSGMEKGGGDFWKPVEKKDRSEKRSQQVNPKGRDVKSRGGQERSDPQKEQVTAPQRRGGKSGTVSR